MLKEAAQLESGAEECKKRGKSAVRFLSLIDKYETFETLTTTMLNEFVEKILVHERARKGTNDTSQEVGIFFNFVGKFIHPHFVKELTQEGKEELRKKEER